MTKTNTNVATILSALSADAADALRSHFRTEVATEIAAGLVAAEKPAARRATAVKASLGGQNRQHTNDGTGRSASQFIRDCGEEMPAKDVVEAATKVGLNIEASLVYNVRAQAKKKVEDTLNEEEAQKKEEARKNALRQNAEKARAARKAKIEKEKADKTAEVPTEAPAAPAEAPAAPEATAPEAPKTEETAKPEEKKTKGKKTAAK